MRSAGDRNPLSAAQVLENHVLNEGVGAVSAKSHDPKFTFFTLISLTM